MLNFNDKQVLIVDDINDSGLTFNQILNSLNFETELERKRMKKNIKTAALWERNSSKFSVDIKPNKIDTKDWIIFPWELPPEEV